MDIKYNMDIKTHIHWAFFTPLVLHFNKYEILILHSMNLHKTYKTTQNLEPWRLTSQPRLLWSHPPSRGNKNQTSYTHTSQNFAIKHNTNTINTLPWISQWFSIGIIKRWVKVGSSKRRNSNNINNIFPIHFSYQGHHKHKRTYCHCIFLSRPSNKSSPPHSPKPPCTSQNNKIHGLNGAHTPWY